MRLERKHRGMKKILFLEDNLGELERASNELIRNNYEVHLASSTDKADDLIKLYGNTFFDCIMLDLNMRNTYLPPALQQLSHGGSITGWIWIYHVMKAKCTNDPKIIIYSEFLTELQDHINDADGVEVDYFRKVTLITKAQAVNGTSALINEVKKLLRQK
jgi:CheY-like chemotaxis protein